MLVPPAPLGKHHEVAEFNSGADELDRWLRDFGWVNHRSGNCRVFVAARGDRVVGYYGLATAGVDRADVPPELTRGGVPSAVPCLLLARLAVDESERNRKMGRGLLVDAVKRAIRVADDVGVRTLLIHARDESAKNFYIHHAEFVPSPTDGLHLFLSMKDAKAAFATSTIFHTS